MNTKATLKLDLMSFWHAGGGRGGGAVVDAVVHRDGNGSPIVPGRHLKGLLRDAIERAGTWDWPGYEKLPEIYFGSRTETLAQGAAATPGSLRVSDACLPADVSNWIGSAEGENVRSMLFHNLYATSVDQNTGTAKDHSLRGIEVSIPLSLEATLSVMPGKDVPEDWITHLEGVLPLINAVGAYRTRGLGRAVLSLEDAS